MEVQDLNGLYQSCCREYLQTIGFERRKQNWFFRNEDFQLALFVIQNRRGVLEKTKLIALALSHNKVRNIDDRFTDNYESDEFLYPISIAPDLLDIYMKSDHPQSIWHYTHRFLNNTYQEKCYTKLSYGDEAVKENQDERKMNMIKGLFKPLIYEKKLSTEEKVNKIIQNISIYGKLWANQMTPEVVLEQYAKYSSGLPIENKIITRYQSYIQS